MTLKLSQQGFALIALPLCLQYVVAGLMWSVVLRADQSKQQLADARMVRQMMDQATYNLLSATRVLAAYQITHEPIFLDRYDQIQRQNTADMDKLRSTAKGDPQLLQVLSEQEAAIAHGFALSKDMRDYLDSGDSRLLLLKLKESKSEYGKIFQQNDVVNTKLKELQDRRATAANLEESQFRAQLQLMLTAGIGLSTVVSILMALAFRRGTGAKIGQLMENTLRLSSDKPLLPKLQGTDELSHLDGVFHDVVDALNEARRRERAITENAVDTICALDEHGAFLSVNPAAALLFGRSAEELKKMSITSFLEPAQLSAVQERFKEVLRTNTSSNFETRIIRADESKIDVSWSASAPAREKTIYCVIHDISQRKELERLKQEFMAMVSHDLRAPLTSMQIFLDSLQKGVYGSVSETVQAKTALVSKSIKILLDLVKDLLYMEKIDIGGIELDYERCLLDDIVEAARESLAETARAREVSIEIRACDDMAVTCDFEKIVRAVVNFLSNAVKYSPAGSSVIVETITLPGQVEIAVIDCGKGIPENMHDAVFDRWKQVEAATDKKAKEGTGLGLAICKTIVEKHGGTVGLTSSPGKGSRFWLRIPTEPVKSGS